MGCTKVEPGKSSLGHISSRVILKCNEKSLMPDCLILKKSIKCEQILDINEKSRWVWMLQTKFATWYLEVIFQGHPVDRLWLKREERRKCMKKARTNRISISLQTYPTILSNARSKQMGEEDLCTALQNGAMPVNPEDKSLRKFWWWIRRISAFLLLLSVVILRTALYPLLDSPFSSSIPLACFSLLLRKMKKQLLMLWMS